MTTAAKKVMVTGATGFIGRRCLPLLAAAGYEVHAITAQPVAHVAQKTVTWHQCDLLDQAACVKTVSKIAPTHLLHTAWIATPGQFWNSPENLRWLACGVTLIDEFYRGGGKRAVGIGTCAEYAWDTADSNEDSSSLRPSTVYGRCKHAMGLAFEAAAATYAGSAAWARLFFPYGPGESSERLIPAVIRGVLRNERVACTHGEQIRDFVFVDDVASALIALLDSPAQGAFNVASGKAISLREVVAVITAQTGNADLIGFGARPPPPGDPARVVADIRKLKREVGWRPSIDIATGIERTITSCREGLG